MNISEIKRIIKDADAELLMPVLEPSGYVKDAHGNTLYECIGANQYDWCTAEINMMIKEVSKRLDKAIDALDELEQT